MNTILTKHEANGDFRIRISPGKFAIADLELLAETLTQLTGERVTALEWFEIVTPSKRAAAAARALMAGDEEDAPRLPVEVDVAAKRAKHEIVAWQVIMGGVVVERITRTEKTHRLERGLFDPDLQRLRHPRTGTLFIVGVKGQPQTALPVNGRED